jgi:dipeptidyl aminopeptidase/acylaminoacyl peptidase
VTRIALCVVAFAAAAHAQQAPYSGLGADSIGKDVVAKFAPPPLDARLLRSIELMLDVRSPGLGIPSPDGRALYFGWGITGSSQVFKLDAPKSFPIQMTGGDENTSIRGVSPDGKWIVLTRDAGGQENPGLFLQPSTGGPLRTVFHAPKVRASFAFVTPDSREVYFAANDVSPDSQTIYRYDIATGTRTRVFGEKGYWAVADHRGSGASLRLLIAKRPSSLASEYYELVPATGQLTPLLGAGEGVLYEVQYGARSGELLVATDRFRDLKTLYRWKVGTDTSAASFREVIAWPDAEVTEFAIDLPRRHVYAELNDRGYTKLVVLDARTYAPIALPLPRDADHIVAGASSEDGRYVKMRYARNGKAPRVGVMGGSYGGYATLVAMTMFAGAYDAGVSNVGISNLESFLRNTAPYRRALRVSEYGDPERDGDALRKLSPVSYIDRVTDPLLIMQGVNDPRVPVGEAVQMHELLAKRGVSAPLILFADDGHGAARRSSAAQQLGHTIRFFDEHLKKQPST